MHVRVLVVLLALSSSAPLFGGWTSAGPDEATPSSVAVDPSDSSTLYAGTLNGGLFKSTDSGGSWKQIGVATFGNRSTSILGISPAAIYATDGIPHRSTNGGASWKRLFPGDESISALATDPFAPSTVYVGNASGIRKSTDGGSTWGATVALSPVAVTISQIAIHPARPNTVHVMASIWGAYRSSDAGATWKRLATPSGVATKQTLHPTDPDVLYLYYSELVLKSTDSGDTWNVTRPALPRDAEVNGLFTTPADPDALFVAVRFPKVRTSILRTYRLSERDGTLVPSETSLQGNGLSSFVVDPTVSTTIYAALFGTGLLVSRDTGRTWSRVGDTGFRNATASALILSPAAPGRVLLGTAQGLRRSTDSGLTWGKQEEALPRPYPIPMAADPLDARVLYAGLDAGFARSTDAGRTFTPFGQGPGDGPFYLTFDPVVPTTVYAARGSSLHKSTDSGLTWAASTIDGKQPYSLAIDPRRPDDLYLAVQEHGVLKSTDAGATWNNRSWGLTKNLTKVVVGREGSETVIFALSGGIFRSRDAAGFWERCGFAELPNERLTALAVDPSQPSHVYVGTHLGRLLRTVDGGVSWVSVGSGLPPGAEVSDIGFDAGPGGPMYLSLRNRGVWRSTDAAPVSSLFIPSVARAEGSDGAFFTTDVTVANTGTGTTTFDLAFIEADRDGRGASEESFALAAGESRTFEDVLATVFERQRGAGALRISSAGSLRASAQTSTRAFGGTFGQGVPAWGLEDLITRGNARSILSVRENARFRTNLVLLNTNEEEIDVEIALVASTGITLATRAISLPPLGTTQLSRVVRAMGVPQDIVSGRLVLTVVTTGGALAAYATVIDNVTQDPRTLLPVSSIGPNTPMQIGFPPPDHWIVPSAVRMPAAGRTFTTTDLTVAYTHRLYGRYTLKLLGHEGDDRLGPDSRFFLDTQRSVTYTDVLGSVFKRTVDAGSIRLSSQYPISYSEGIAAMAETQTPGFGGTFGQSLPVFSPKDLIRAGASPSILAIREDEAFRTDLVLANASEAGLEVDVTLVSKEGAILAAKRYALSPLARTEVARIVRQLGIGAPVRDARLVLSIATPDGALAAYASVIDNVTNDPRTLLAR